MNHYYLLPFRFTRIMEQELLVNELGDFIFTPKIQQNESLNAKLITKKISTRI